MGFVSLDTGQENSQQGMKLCDSSCDDIPCDCDCDCYDCVDCEECDNTD